MFTTVDEVKELTGYDVTAEVVAMAQGIVEIYVGKNEAEVIDADDIQILGSATAYQAAYMNDNPQQTFEQIALRSIDANGQSYVFPTNNQTAPWIAPLAVLACQKLSWKRTRSIRIGSMFPPVQPCDWSTS